MLFLFAVAAAAAALDAVAGGGGLLTVPALLFAGFNPVAAIATNKLQGVAGTVSAAAGYARAGTVSWPAVRAPAAAAAAASLLGASLLPVVPRRMLAAAIPVLLLATAAYFARARRLGANPGPPRLGGRPFALCAGAIGLYDGAFGPGAGAFYTAAFAGLRGEALLRATAHAKVANAASNGASCALFLASGASDWRAGLLMACGAALGGALGARLAVRVGPRLIRPLIVAVAVAVAVRLLLDPAGPWARFL